MKIKFAAILFIAVSGLFFCTSSLPAQTDTLPAVTTSVNVDLVSRYIWRGMDLGHGPSIQPGLSATWKDFTIGTWGAFKLNGEGDQETDFYLSKTFSFVTVAIWDYWSFNDTSAFDCFNYLEKTTSHLLEAQILLSGGETLPFNFLASYLFYGADPSKSVYFELQYEHTSSLADLVVFAGYQAKGNYYAPKPAFVNIGCTVSKSIQVTDRLSLPVYVSLIVNPAGKSAWLVAGITL
jgi:hypothetical protein